MKKTLGSLKVDERTIINMKNAIQKYNTENLVALSECEFRRLSYEVLAQMILTGKAIPVKIR